MDVKLTLNVEKSIVEEAKSYAKSQKVSLSHLIETYLYSLTRKKGNAVEITPIVKSLSGVINLENDFDYKAGYADYLVEKYK